MPRTRIRNIAGGRSAGALGIKELTLKLKEMQKSITAEEQGKYTKQTYDVIGEACEEVRRAARTIAQSKGVHQLVIDSIFTFADPWKGPRKRRPSGLVGVAKQPTLIEWRAGKHPASQSLEGRPLTIKRAPGEILAVSLAFMEEFGTSRKRSKSYFRPAVAAARDAVRQKIQTGLTKIINSIAWGK